MQIKGFFDTRTFTVTYVVYDADSRDAVIIDPVADYEPIGSKLFFESLDRVLDFVQTQALTVHYILETHAHADHLSGAPILRQRLGAKTAINARITMVQEVFKGVFDLPDDFPTDGSQFDRLLEDGEIVQAGALKVQVIGTPGHTPACTSFLIEDALFTGDVIFMPDQGTGRCDFPAGSVADMYRSVHDKVYALPDATRIFVGHDYQPGGREIAWETTVAAQKAKNVQLKAETTEAEFAEFRSARDKSLAAPKLLFQSVQANIAGGRLPIRSGEKRFLKIPVNVFPSASLDALALAEI